MMRTIIACLLFTISLSAQVDTLWTKVYSGDIIANGQDIIATNSGGYAITGRISDVEYENYIYLLRTDSNGDSLWSKKYQQSGASEGSSLIQNSDGSFLIAGKSNNSSNQSLATIIKTDSLGNEAWVRTYGMAGSSINDVIRSSDGNYFAVGQNLSKAWIVKFSDVGDTLWTNSIINDNTQSFSSIEKLDDNSFIIGGTSYDGGRNGLIAKIDLNGNFAWARTYGHSSEWEQIYSICSDASGQIVAAGYTTANTAGGSDLWILSVTDTGDSLWSNSFGGPYSDYGYSIKHTFDDSYVVAGSFQPSNANNGDVFVVKTNSLGDEAWSLVFGGDDTDRAWSITQNADETFIMVGTTESYGTYGSIWINQLTPESYYGPVWHVSASGSDSNDGSTTLPFASIQHAIDATRDGDTVLVQPGTYVENLNFNGKNIVVGSLFLSTQDTSYISQTIIDGNQNGSVVVIGSGESASSMLCGFVIQNGLNGDGGAIQVANSHPTLDHLVITNCTANNSAGGIYLYNSESVVSNSTISNTIGAHSGGLLGWGGSPTLINLLIYNNQGGVAGGIKADGCNMTIKHSTIVKNMNSGIWAGNTSTVNIENSIFYNNGASPSDQIVNGGSTRNVSYSLVEGGYAGEGNINLDPIFQDFSLDNFKLQNYSPAIGSGSNDNTTSTDIEGNPRPNPAGSNPDIGAYESPLATPLHNSFIHVSTEGDDNGSVGVESAPFATIQAAIDYSQFSDTVLVHPGTYVENINFSGKNIVLGSLILTTQDTSYVTQTIIDGNQSGTVVSIESGESIDAQLVGLTIQNGIGTSKAGGISVISSSPTLQHLRIINNSVASGYSGGGISCNEYSNPVLSDLEVSGNSGVQGGGIYLLRSNPSISNVKIIGNDASWGGGGLFCNTASPVLNNVLISGNSTNTQRGSGIYCEYDSEPLINRTTISGNICDSEDGGMLYCANAANPKIENSVLWNSPQPEVVFNSEGGANSVEISYTNILGGLDSIVTNNNGSVMWQSGNKSVNPQFVGEGIGDYDLLASSMCINAGHPDSTDSDGTRADMGAVPYLNSYTGSDWYVAVGGDDISGTGALSHPFASIQAGINFATPTDSVLVGPGIYFGTANFLGKEINVVGIEGVEETILDGEGAFNIVTFANGESRNAVLSGFTIQNGRSDWAAYHTEGAVYIDGSSPTIRNCIIQDCQQYYYGSAIGLWHDASPLLDGLILRNNLSIHGGAIAANGVGDAILKNSSIYNNHATSTGGGIYAGWSTQKLRVINCTVVSNTADGLYDEFWGGGAFTWVDSSIEITNSVFWNNTPNQIQDEDTLYIPTSYTNVEGTYPGLGNISFPPHFVDEANKNFNLNATSYCINAGHPDSTDSDGSRVDMGALPYLNEYSGPNWHVAVGGDNVSGTGELSDPFASIQAGINFTSDHDSVFVGPGTYTENVDFRGHSVSVRGIDGAINTIVNGNASGSVFSITSEEDTTTSIHELTIQNGSGTFVYINDSNQGTYGGGIFVNNASLKLTSCNVIENHVTYSGGGIGAYQSQYIRIFDCDISENSAAQDGGGAVISHSFQAEVTSSQFWNNSAHNGGGLFVNGVDAILTGLELHGNVATSQGGGIYQGSSSILRNSLIYNNQADYGGGVNSRGSSPVFVNNTIINNAANASGGGIISTDATPSLKILNSIIFSNSAPEGGQIHTWDDGVTEVRHSLIEDWTSENGNSTLDPRFFNLAENNFHLSNVSPALGRGLDTTIVPLFDIEGNPRPNPAGSNPDIGAYESPLAEPIVIVEVQNLHIGGSEETLHLTSHNPEITYSYYNSLEEPLGFHQIQVSSLSDFSLIDKWDTYTVINPDTIVTYAGNALVDGENYYLRVKAGSGDIWTDWVMLSFSMNSIPLAPALVSPIANTVIGEDLLFTVENSLDSEEDEILYQFFLFEDVAMTVLVDSSELVAEGVDQTMWLSEAELLDNNQYWWTSRVFDGYEYSSLSAPASFLVNTENAAPETFELLFPTPEIVISSLTPTFSWHSSLDVDPEDIVSYSLHLDTPEPGVLIFELGSDTLFFPPEPLLDNTVYYWRVVANDLLGFETESLGGYRSFVVNVSNDNPSVVDLITPDSVMVLSLTPEMFWTRATDVDPGDMVTYEMHWWGDGIEYDSVLTDTNAVVIPRELQDNMQYFWEVIAMDQTDGISHSEPATFWTDLVPEAPEGFALLSPENDAAGLPDMPSFQWEIAEDPDPMDYATYTLQIASDSSFSDVVFETNTNVEAGLELTESLPTDTEYWWRVVATDSDSLTTESEIFKFTVGYVSIAEEIALPTEYMLNQNYPNPFNPSTTIRYGLPEEVNVSLVIYDVRGQVVQTLEAGHQSAGWYDVVWNGQTADGRTISTGIYFARLVAGDYSQVIKMLFLK